MCDPTGKVVSSRKTARAHRSSLRSSEDRKATSGERVRFECVCHNLFKDMYTAYIQEKGVTNHGNLRILIIWSKFELDTSGKNATPASVCISYTIFTSNSPNMTATSFDVK
jgi:hypothetical protein